jgi:hypothetical protein
MRVTPRSRRSSTNASLTVCLSTLSSDVLLGALVAA